MFCNKGLNVYFEYKKSRCPIYDKKILDFLPLKLFEENIFDLNLRCVNYKLCQWKILLINHKEHLNICPKEIINCPNRKYIIKLRRKDMDKHLIICEYKKVRLQNCKTKLKYMRELKI